MRTRTWVLIGVGIALTLMVGCAVFVGASVYLVTRQMDVRPSSASTAAEEFDRVLRRFDDPTPLVVLGAGGRTTTDELERRARAYSGRLPETLHVLVWEAGDERLVRLQIPFWLLRLSPGDSMNFSSSDLDLERLHLSVADLERAGPAIVIDERDDRHRLLVWTE